MIQMKKFLVLMLGSMLTANLLIAENNKLVEELSLKVGVAKTDVKLRNNIAGVSLPSKRATIINLEVFTKCDYIKSYGLNPFIDVNTIINTDRNIYSLGIGVKKDIETDLVYKPYVSASAGYALLDWKTSPLINATQKDETTRSIVGTLQTGIRYKNFDIAIRYDRYNFDTKLTSGLVTSMLNDKYSLSLLVGVLF